MSRHRARASATSRFGARKRTFAYIHVSTLVQSRTSTSCVGGWRARPLSRRRRRRRRLSADLPQRLPERGAHSRKRSRKRSPSSRMRQKARCEWWAGPEQACVGACVGGGGFPELCLRVMARRGLAGGRGQGPISGWGRRRGRGRGEEASAARQFEKPSSRGRFEARDVEVEDWRGLLLLRRAPIQSAIWPHPYGLTARPPRPEAQRGAHRGCCRWHWLRRGRTKSEGCSRG